MFSHDIYVSNSLSPSEDFFIFINTFIFLEINEKQI